MTTISFHRNTLSDQIKRIKGLIDKNPVLPILSDFHFVLSGDKAEITATNLSQTGQVVVPFTPAIDEELTFTIEAASFIKLVEAGQSILTMKIELDTHKRVTIQVPNGEYHLPVGEDETLFPETNSFDYAEHYFHTSKEQFAEMFGKTIYAIGHDENRPAMCCIYQKVEVSGACSAIATDAHRLAKVWNAGYCQDPDNGGMPMFSYDDKAIKILWPLPVIKNLLKFIVSDDIFRVVKTDARIFIQDGQAHFSFAVVDSVYLDAEAVIPSIPVRIESVDIHTLQEIIDRMIVVAPEHTRMVRLTFNKSHLYIRAEDFDYSRSGVEVIPLIKVDDDGEVVTFSMIVDGQDYDVIDSFSAAEAMTVHVNIKSLQEAINALEYQNGVVQFGINGASRPLTMQSFEEFNGIEAGEIHLLMPLNPGNGHE